MSYDKIILNLFKHYSLISTKIYFSRRNIIFIFAGFHFVYSCAFKNLLKCFKNTLSIKCMFYFFFCQKREKCTKYKTCTKVLKIHIECISRGCTHLRENNLIYLFCLIVREEPQQIMKCVSLISMFTRKFH